MLQHQASKVKFTNSMHSKAFPDPNVLLEVTDLCYQLSRAKLQSKSLKLYLSDNRSLLCAIDNASAISTFNTSSMTQPLTTLDAVLDQYHHAPGNDKVRFWSTTQRMHLAATLASSMLQLCTTPWLSQSWSRQDVYFHSHSPANVGTITSFEARHPFLVQNFWGKSKAQQHANQLAKEDILELGVLLLEIFDGRTIESWAQEAQTTLTKSPSSRCHIAGQWLDYREPEMLPKYRSAVASCLDIASSRAQSSRTWDDPNLQKEMLETVVQPLVTACM